MNTKILCLASPKGGSGKTIITANFASFLTELGKKCLVIDCDIATHGLTLLYLHNTNEHISSKEKLNPIGIFDDSNIDFERDIVQIENNVDFLPATYSFELPENLDIDNFENKLKSILLNAKEKYDYIFLDAQAGSDSISRIAMKKDISDEVIIVSEYDPLSAAGIERLKSVIGKELEFTRTWILLNKMLPEFVEKFSDFLSVAKYLTPIPWNADVVRAYSRKQLAIDLKYGNEYTLAIIQTLKTLLGTKVAEEIDNWANKRASNIREPLEIQYSDSEQELISLLNLKNKFSKIKTRRSFIFTLLGTTLIFIFSFFISYLTDKIYLFDIDILHYMNNIDTSIVSITSAIIALVVFTRFQESKTSEDKVEESRIKRKIEILEERLKQLDALQKADYKTLIKKANKT